MLTMAISKVSSRKRVMMIMTKQADENHSVHDICQRSGSNGHVDIVLETLK